MVMLAFYICLLSFIPSAPVMALTTKSLPVAVPYISQTYDTPNDFIGSAACGPTSAVMILAHYARVAPRPITVNQPFNHTSNYGSYVSQSYTYKANSFSAVKSLPTACGTATGAGAWGYIWQAGGNTRVYMESFLERHDFSATLHEMVSATATSYYVKQEIDNNRPLIALTLLTEAGHYVVIVGYETDSQGNVIDYLVNDPFGTQISHDNYGGGCWGTFDTQPVRYTYAQMGNGGTIPALLTITSTIPPAKPVPASPATSTNQPGNIIDFSWSPVAGATDYKICVSTTPDFATSFHMDTTNGICSKSYSDFPNNGTTYYWQVIPYNSAGWGNWSDQQNFTNGITAPVNNSPQLTKGAVNPASGTTSTDFLYDIWYSDPDGDIPTTKLVYINGVQRTMSFHDGSQSNGTYAYTTTLTAGTYNYYFYFDDGRGGTVRLPSTGTLTGPVVSSTTPSSGYKNRISDFNNDNNSEFAVWRPGSGCWYINPSSTPTQFGLNGDIPVPADYNGDGATERAIYRPSTGCWYVYPSFTPIQFGLNGDIPVPADYNGDGTAERAVYRPSTGCWYVYPSFTPIQFGLNGDIPVPADYNNDRTTERALYRPSTGNWYIYPSFTPTQFGLNGDIPVPADYNGDGTTERAIWRPGTGNWYVYPSFTPTQYGLNGDLPCTLTPGNYYKFFKH